MSPYLTTEQLITNTSNGFFPFAVRYEPGRHNRESGAIECRYNHNKGYVVFSAMGSFFIPMTVMLYVYSRICCVLTSRHNSMAKTEVLHDKLNPFGNYVVIALESCVPSNYYLCFFVAFSKTRTGIGENQCRWHRLRQPDIRIREFAESTTQIGGTLDRQPQHSK